MPALSFDAAAVNAMLLEAFPESPNRCIELGRDAVLVAYEVSDRDVRPGGFVSGPTQFNLVDCALWVLTFAALDRIEPMALTAEISIRYLRPAVGTRLLCRATLDAANRRSVVGTARVWCDDPARPTATAQGTYAVPLPR